MWRIFLFIFTENYSCMFFFISGAEIVFIFFIILLVFGADKIPSIARTLAKGMTQIRQATDDIKSEIQRSADIDFNQPTQTLQKKFENEVKEVKDEIEKVSGVVKRKKP